MNKLPAPITSRYSEMLVNAAHRVLRAFARLFTGRMTFDVMTELLRRAVIEEARRKLSAENGNSRVSLSRMALMTGMDTRHIKRTQNEPLRLTEIELSFEARMLARWTADERFLDPETRKPAKLCIYGPGPTFQALISAAGGHGITVPNVLERLVESGNVEVVDDQWVQLLSSSYTKINKYKSEEDHIEFGSYSMNRIVDSLLHNIEHPDDPENRRVLRSYWSVALPERNIPELRAALSNLLKEQYKQTGKLIDSFETNDPDVQKRVIGADYLYWESDFRPPAQDLSGALTLVNGEGSRKK